MTKDLIRKRALEVRNKLTMQQVEEHSRAICHILSPMVQRKECKIGIYLAYGKEVDLSYLNCGATSILAIPKTFPDHTLRFYRYDRDTILEKTTYGIQEPVDGEEIAHLDILIIPMVAFDKQCNRLGHGLGFYDRYLQHFHGLKIGVAHQCQQVDDVFAQDHDQILDRIITEDSIYHNVK